MSNIFCFNRSMLLATLGTTIEWAEYIFYGYMAISLSQLFFPPGHETINLIKTFGLFAAGYLMRPIGAVLFGHLGDKFGRKPALMLSMILMAFATMGIGLLPTYASIGIWAPILLLGLRLVQGLAVSGEYNGAAIFVIEHNPHKPCFYGSLVPASAAFGMVLGGIAAAIVSMPNMPIWAYRVPFLLGGLGCLLVLWLRQNLSDSHEFNEAKQQQARMSIFSLLTQYPWGFLRVGAIAAMTGVYVYVGNVYFVIYLIKDLGLASSSANVIALCGQALVAIGIPLCGALADAHGAMRIYKKGLWLAVIALPLQFYLSSLNFPGMMLIAISLYALANAYMSGSMMSIVQQSFPTLARYRGTSLAWSISVAIFGGTTLIVAQWLQDKFQLNFACTLYPSLIALITLMILNLKQTSESKPVSSPIKMSAIGGLGS